jgi:hypothetical protein
MMNIYEESTINFWIWHGSCFSLGRVCVKLCGCFILFRYCYKCTNFAMYFSAYSLYYFTFTQYLFSQNLNTSIYNCVSNCQEYSLKWINKTAGFVKCFLVEYLLTAISTMPDISTSVLKQKIYKTDMCSCYKIARLCKLQKRVHSTRGHKW